MLRKIWQDLNHKDHQEQETDIQYSQENAILFEQNEAAAKERPLKERKRLLKGTTDSNNKIKIVFKHIQAEPGERKKTTAKIFLQQE